MLSKICLRSKLRKVKMVVETINGIGYTITQTVTTVLKVNHFIGENVVNLALGILSYVKTAIMALCAALNVALEDLAIFIAETLESFVNIMDFFFACIDAVVASVANGIMSVKAGIWFVSGSIYNFFNGIARAVVYASTNFGCFLNLACNSLLFLLGLIPRTLYLLVTSSYSGMCSLMVLVSDATIDTLTKVQRAPVETFVGFAGAILLILSLRRLSQRSSANTRQVIHVGLKLLCLCYFYVMKSLIFGARCLIKLVEMTLSHLHVTRFHHAGDSDAEEDLESRGGVVVDDSDENENERMSDKRRNYDLLLRRRAERRQRLKRSRSKKKDNDDDSDVEELLFEQMEREREDKLCVVCQDKEKCIMILPCRHLCVCQDCQVPLQARNNHCPICRKHVRQYIKAYL